MQHEPPPAGPRSLLYSILTGLSDVIFYPIDRLMNLLLKRQLHKAQTNLAQSLEALRHEQAQALHIAQSRFRAKTLQSQHESAEKIRQLELKVEMALRANQILSDRLKAYVHQRLAELEPPAPLDEMKASGSIDTHNAQDDPQLTRPLRFLIEGPFETSYSLAIINRHLAFALDNLQPGSVGLFATEGPGDYQPDPLLIAQTTGLEPLWQRGLHASASEIVIRNLYPPRVHDMRGKLNLLHFYWEESSIPASYVADFNRYLNGILAPTHFVKKLLRDNGVYIPIEVIGVGVDHILTQDLSLYRGALGKGFRFLHVSSGFERKGLDLLIEAFASAFTRDDDVILIIKTFANPHNRVHELIAHAIAKYPSCPPIQVIEEELSPGQILDLYARSDCFVSATRGEGFGLPMAEAMLQDVPVIVSSATGHADFCNPETAFIIRHEPEPSRSHMGLADSLWAEPDLGDLIRQLRKVYKAPDQDLQSHRQKARENLLRQFTWSACANRIAAFVNELQRHPPIYKTLYRIGTLTIGSSDDQPPAFVRETLDELSKDEFQIDSLTQDQLAVMTDLPVDAVLITLSPGQNPWPSLQDAITHLEARMIPLLICVDDLIACRMKNPIEDADLKALLAPAKRILTASLQDMKTLKTIGLEDKSLSFATDHSAAISSPHTTPLRSATQISGLIKAMCSLHW